MHLLGAAKAAARLAGRDFVTPDDVGSMAPAVLAHRLVLTPEAELERYEGRRRRAHGARRCAGAAMSPAPRAAVILAAIALLTALTSPAVGGLAALVLAGAVRG